MKDSWYDGHSQRGMQTGDLSHHPEAPMLPNIACPSSRQLQPSNCFHFSSTTFISNFISSASSILESVRLRPLSLIALLLVSIFCGSTAATAVESGVHLDRQRSAEEPRLANASFSELLVDLTEAPVPRMPFLRRGESDDSSPLNSHLDARASDSSTTSLPVPFDTNLASNFSTSSCPTFFNKFLANTTLQNCHPLSLLLENSNSFFDASKSFVRITQALDASCNVNFAQCLPLMQYYASQLISDSNCGVDYRNGNALVVQAYYGFVAYEPLYLAGCLKDGKGNYCYAGAITNKSSVADSYPYYLAVGNDLPGSSRPTCNTCLQTTMAVFNPFAGNSTQPLSKTYVKAAQQINIGCGPTFVNSTVQPVSNSAYNLAAPQSSLPLLLIAVLLSIFLA